MNVFLSPSGPGGTRFGAVAVSDAHCHDIGYAAGFGDLQWRAYLDGTAADGEAQQIARNRIGPGPWINSRGVVVARNLEELHSDSGNLNRNTALTLTGEAPPADFPLPAFGNGLRGSAFSRNGPLLCFGVR